MTPESATRRAGTAGVVCVEGKEEDGENEEIDDALNAVEGEENVDRVEKPLVVVENGALDVAVDPVLKAADLPVIAADEAKEGTGGIGPGNFGAGCPSAAGPWGPY